MLGGARERWEGRNPKTNTKEQCEENFPFSGRERE